MYKFLINILILFTLLSCNNNNKRVVNDTPQMKVDEKVKEVKKDDIREGFLFIDVSYIYHNGGQVNILNQNKKPTISIIDKLISINNESFDVIEDEHLYKEKIKVESFFPEYGLFIIKSKSASSGFYEVQINNKNYFIKSNEYGDLVSFKLDKQYVLNAYPNPTKENPLRVNPDESSDIISNYEDYTFVSVEIKGDWLKVRDDKDCYPGETPSEKDITGWVRWKKDGKIIIDIRHIC